MRLFILASNDLSISPEDMLNYYKGQDNVEKGFRFLKSDTFSVSKIYRKNKTRIEALTIIMVFCLMIYYIAEWKLRTKLEEENETVLDQKGKLTKRPTMRWIFFNSQELTELISQTEGEIESEIFEYGGNSLEDIGSHGEKYENIYL